MHLFQERREVFEEGKRILINIARPDAIFRVGKSRLVDERREIQGIYFDKQHHESLAEFLNNYLKSTDKKHFIQV